MKNRNRSEKIDEIVVADPVDFFLEKRIRRFAEKHDVTLTITETPMFLTSNDWADENFDGREKPFMAAFYEEQRKRMGILVDDGGEPEGGQWSFDYDTGDWCQVWDGLFWKFIDRHFEFLKSQHRLGMMVATWNKMSGEKRKERLETAEEFLQSL